MMIWLHNEIFFFRTITYVQKIYAFMSFLLYFYDEITWGHQQRLKLWFVAIEVLSQLFET